MNKKQSVLTEIYARCKRRGDYVFTNDEDVKPVCADFRFKNAFDVTKIDTSRDLPEALVKDDVFVIHLGEGKHQFVKGIANAYHPFEPIPDERTHPWPYRRSLLNDIHTSKSSVPWFAYNQRIIHDFLYENVAASPWSYLPHRTQLSVECTIGDTWIETRRLPVKINFMLEHRGGITVFEAQNGSPGDFNVLHLYNQFRYYRNVTGAMGGVEVSCCYVLRDTDRVRLYLYTFTDPVRPSSIQLLRSAKYALAPRRTHRIPEQGRQRQRLAVPSL